jgi:hypothetical protein
VLENTVMGRIFRPERDELMGNEELPNLYSPPSIIRMIISRGGEMGRAYSANSE